MKPTVSMRAIDLFLGVKAEQTLRDAARAATESSEDEPAGIELCPVGRKDWIVGGRLGSAIRFGDLAARSREVVRRLLELKSHQRIRQEAVRVHAVRTPVPVFKDTAPGEGMEGGAGGEAAAAVVPGHCPVCGVEVHEYNILRDVSGRAVGCYLCRGVQKRY